MSFGRDDSLFRHRSFVLYWLARVFSTSGYQVQSVAVAWQVYELTGRAFDLGLVGLMQFLPRVLLVAVVGNAADRYDRRKLMLAAQAVQAATLLVLTVASATGAVSRELIFALVLVAGAARSFELPVTQALLPALIAPAGLSRAVAMSASAGQAATILAPALGGFLYLLGATVVYTLTTAAFVVAAAATTAIRVAPQVRAAMPGSGIAHFLEGIRFIRRQRAILGAISLDLCAVFLGGATALLPIIAHEILATGPWGLGLLRSAPAVGALLMAIGLAHHPLRRAIGKLMFGCVAVFGLATIAFGLSHSLALSLAILAVLGGADMVSVVIRNAYVQLQTPDAMRGRVSAVNSVFIGASNQLGEFESGVTAAWFGVVPAVVLGGVGTLLVVAIWMRRFPELLHAQRLER
ncbi:MAG: MFS transporter [Rhodocyclaceae bacterium]|nr:MFS transporter [Rhodocyclaceae bacterium]